MFSNLQVYENNDLKPYGTYLNMLAHKYDKGQVFEDFLQIIVCCLQMGRAEELYFKTIKKYSRDELQYFLWLLLRWWMK